MSNTFDSNDDVTLSDEDYTAWVNKTNALNKEIEKLKESPTPVEAVTSFAAWLTTLPPESSPFIKDYDCAHMVALVKAFNESQEFPPPRYDYIDRIKPYPTEPMPSPTTDYSVKHPIQ